MDTIARAHALLNGLQARGIHYDLDAIAWALEKRGNPERKVKSLIVAGTNGKGSTSILLHYMLRRLGFRTGLYTSPHLIDVRERIRIDQEIPAELLAQLIVEYDAQGLLGRLTYYEALTLAAFDWFAEQEVEWAILEVGVGGRLDAVNLAPAEGAVITSIDFDHRELLGDTIAKIAAEKAGVIKRNRPVVVGNVPAEAFAVIESVAAAQSALVYREGVAFSVKRLPSGLFYDGQSPLVIPEVGLPGAFQTHNVACALGALERIVGIDPASAADDLRQALRDARWPARFQQLSGEPLIVLDAAHNPAGARVLAEAFRERYGEQKVTLVFAALADKDHNAMLAVLRPMANNIWLTQTPDQPRAVEAGTLASDAALEGAVFEQVAPEELGPRIRAAAKDTRFLVTGSIAFAGWFLENWQGS
jgi:dihydrofolate synthase/folylpolyglutamate synthase